MFHRATRILDNIAVAATLILLTSVAQGAVTTPASDEKGLEIARERKLRDTGWRTSAADLEMVLTGRGGQSSTRSLRLRSLEVTGDGAKTLAVFDLPLDIKGTAVLTFSHIHGPDAQWLFLPSIRRVKRVASNNKSGAFMGSEFAFEDLSSYEVEKYGYRYLGEEVLDGMPMFKVESYPRYEHSGYSKLVNWIDQESYRVHRIEYYDLRGSLLKIHTLTGYQRHGGKFWRANEQTIENQQTGKRTTVKVKRVDIGIPLSGTEFDQSALSRIR